MDTLSVYPSEIRAVVKEDIERVFHVDFTGDSAKDYIVQTKTLDHDETYLEIWLTSDYIPFARRVKGVTSYDFFYFINLDDDSEPEMYSANGYEDGIDYAIYDLNMKTGSSELMFYLNPVIIENETDYWGHPWFTSGIMTKTVDGKTMVHVSLNHDIERMGEITIPDNQFVLPVIFLIGHAPRTHTMTDELRERTWMTIEEIRTLCTTP